MPSPEEYRSLELDAAAATGVARQPTVVGNFLKVAVPTAAVCLAAWFIYNASQQRRLSMTAPDKEEFQTTQFPAPSFSQPAPQTDQGRFTIPSEPAPVPAPPAQPPAALPPPPPPEPMPSPALNAPASLGNDEEARRLAELERQRREEEERRKWERFRAPQVIADNNNGDSPSLGANAGDVAARPGATENETDPNRRFLASAGSAGVEVSRATQNDRIDALVAQGTMIRAVLENAVQSDLPGMVRAVTMEDVWSFDGRRVLIPSGTRLIGEYKSGLSVGQTRVFVVWTRLLRSDGVSVQLGSIGTDDLGRAGNAGFLDNHYVERFGAAIMLSVIGGSAQYIAGLGQNANNTNGSTTTTTDPVTGIVTTTQTGGMNYQQQQARQIAAQNVSQTLTNIAQEALKNAINIPPTIYLDQGTRVIVFVRRDLDFSAFYPDPVKEALQELRRERNRDGSARLSR